MVVTLVVPPLRRQAFLSPFPFPGGSRSTILAALCCSAGCSYCKGVDFLELCYKVEVPACLLLRRLLEGLCEGASRKVSHRMESADC